MVKVLLIIVLIILGIRLLWNSLFAGLFGITPREFRQRSKEAASQQGASRPDDHRAEGEVKIQYNPEKDGKKPPTGAAGGEYVDYEEVKD